MEFIGELGRGLHGIVLKVQISDKAYALKVVSGISHTTMLWIYILTLLGLNSTIGHACVHQTRWSGSK